MEIVIKMSEIMYDWFDNGFPDEEDAKKLWHLVKNGALLPKGHGRLIDENYLLCILQCEEYETCTWRNCEDCNREKCIRRHNMSEVPTIIEADKADKDE